MSATKLEEFVLNELRSLANNPTARERLIMDRSVEISTSLENDYNHATKMIADIERRRQRIKAAYEAGVDSLEVYAANKQRLDDEESKYHVVTDDYQIKLQQVNERKQRLEKFFKSVDEFNRLWDECDFQERKHLVRSLYKETKVGNGQILPEWRF
jgi:Na+/phosphate symporter